ncbi:MAG TPA: phosphomannomutase/phosphoglucomutase [Burkholderiaceae bacterium]|nr:phosphomannomutase/phosphoglucomutase [Burkholderiaceae bacterium]
MKTAIDPSIFKAYDIRGVVGRTLTVEAARAIGAALGSEALVRGCSEIAVGRDGRLSGPQLRDALIDGIRSTGTGVVDIGMVATPMLYFATFHLGTRSGVEITGSHNPPEYNGLKIVLAGDAMFGDGLQGLRRRIETADLARAATPGPLRTVDIEADYIARIVGDVKLARPLKIAVDCGNGVAGRTAPALFRALGCEVVELFCDVDGNFPNHHPDPAHLENLQDLIRCLRETDAELGLAFDGDGDRLGVVTKAGNVIFPDRQMMLFARGVLREQPGAAIVYDVKCSRQLAVQIRAAGGQPLMWRTGHSLIKAKLKETGAPLAGEMSGHIFFKHRWYGFDDGLYAGARLLELLAREKHEGRDPSAVLEALPDAVSTPELQMPTAEGESFALVERLKTSGRFPTAREVNHIDGVRVEYDDGFGLARPSNTTPIVVMRFEGDSAAALSRIQEEFRAALLALKPDARLPF